jgi:hypothetical protein
LNEESRKKSSEISRRDFLKEASLLVGSAAIGSPALLTACSGGQALTEPDLLTVLNPQGQPPPIVLVPMAPRLNTLDGKMIYVVDIHFTGTQQLTEELANVLNEKYPNTKILYKVKKGSYSENDPELWNEIGENADAVVMGIGH